MCSQYGVYSTSVVESVACQNEVGKYEQQLALGLPLPWCMCADLMSHLMLPAVIGSEFPMESLMHAHTRACTDSHVDMAR